MLAVALDMSDAGAAYDLSLRLQSQTIIFKVGLELLYSDGGIALVKQLSAGGVPVFVDAKLFDIPNTVERTAARIADLGASFLTVHGQDRETLDAAMRGAKGSTIRLLAVTVLTSARGYSGTARRDLVRSRSDLAADAGFYGVVCGAADAPLVKSRKGPGLAVVTPGIRPRTEGGLARDDQVDVATPRDAVLAGADYIVVGRPVLRAEKPERAVRDILAEIAQAQNERTVPAWPNPLA